MTNAADMSWFKQNFQADMEPALAGTPFTVDFMVALACQETGEVWPILRKKPLTRDQIAALCVGDTIDFNPTTGKGRTAFPKTKADLVAKSQGDQMFAIARQALQDMATQTQSRPYLKALENPNKFCHGYGVFQYDLQFFRDDPDYFLQKKYELFSESLGKALSELKSAAKKIGFDNRPTLSDFELCAVAIAYNTGRFIPSKGLKQGFQVDGRFYGELINDFLQLAHTVPGPGRAAPVIPPPPPGNAIVPPPTPIAATGAFFRVSTQVNPLRVRSEPRISRPPQANVIAHLPDGHLVRAVSGEATNGFREIETSLNGANIRGFASADFLKPAPGATEIPVVAPDVTPPASGIVEVFMPHAPGSVTKRTAPADAHSLNEPDMPDRKGTTPVELCTELAAIIDYLAVDKASFKRYQPRDGLTFCNIYAHDYCHLAGVYLPRVWWSQAAIVRLSHGETVEPRIGQTIDEQRANDLFRWLRDFGPRFGWRQTGTMTKLQQHANQGGVAIIVARRKEDGRSGHIVMVVPETADERAKRNGAGDVTQPLQSQAGARNFRYGGLTGEWWRSDQFAESAFWLHA
jgi:hypothetical protein